MEIINGMFIGAAVGAIVAIPALVSEIMRRGKNLPILLDVRACWGRKCTDAEVFVLSLFLHFLFAIAFGGLYMFLVSGRLYFADFVLVSLLEYAIYFWLAIGILILPAVRLGLFGRKEGRWTWLELLASFLLFGIGFWAALRLFPVFLPV